MFLCNECAPDSTDIYHVGQKIIGQCENDSCTQADYPVEQTPVRNYVLRVEFEEED